MLTSVEIKNFRGIREGRLEGLTPLSILVGPNGSGKSTILDAILIGANPNPARGIAQTVARREEFAGGWPWLLWKRGSQGEAHISVTLDSSFSRGCTLTLAQPPPQGIIQCDVVDFRPGARQDFGPITVDFTHNKATSFAGSAPPLKGVPEVLFIGPFPKNELRPLHELYSELVREGKREEITAIVGGLIPGFRQMEVLTENGAPVLYVDFTDRAVPAALAGDGIALLLRLGFELTVRSGGVALMEEPEVHAHPAALRQAARSIVAAVRRGVQVVLTTHSMELIDALLAQASTTKDTDKISVFRLQLQDGVLQSSRLAGPEVAFARGAIEDDLR
jgi:predicted ATPase